MATQSRYTYVYIYVEYIYINTDIFSIVVPYIDQYWQILTKYWQKMTKTVKNMSFSKGACQNKTKRVPAASLKRSNNGLGLPVHIKKLPILLDIRYYILNIRYYLYIYYLYIYLSENWVNTHGQLLLYNWTFAFRSVNEAYGGIWEHTGITRKITYSNRKLNIMDI